MYTRSYDGDLQKRPLPPPNYDGTAFLEDKTPENIDTGTTIPENKQKNDRMEETVQTSAGIGFSLPFGLGSLFSGHGLRIPKIGTEEILIIATGLFLLMSKDGDLECAILLFLLLLIN